MTDDIDPFAALNNEEGMSGFIKFCIFLGIAGILFALYFHSSGEAEKYKEPPISQDFSIANLESKELSSDELEDYAKSKEHERQQQEEKASTKTPDQVGEATQARPNPQPQQNIVTEPKEELKSKQEYVAPEQPQQQLSPDGTAIKQQSIADGMAPMTMDTLRQPLPSKGDWMKEMPDYAKLTRAQRITPIENRLYDDSFNDINGEISISESLGKPSFYFRKSFAETKVGSAKIAIIIYGLGLSPGNTAAAINSLPANVSMSFSPYSSNAAGMIDDAREAGHETLLDIPLQAKNYPLTDPGSMGLLQSNTTDDNRANLQKLLSLNVPVIGFFSINGDAFSVSAPSISLIAAEFKNRGLAFVDGNTETIIGEFDMDYLKPDVVIKDGMFKEQIIASLLDAKKIALKKGVASLAVDASLLPIHLLKEFIEKDVATNPNLELAPISFLID